jgi:hypothetical protein
VTSIAAVTLGCDAQILTTTSADLPNHPGAFILSQLNKIQGYVYQIWLTICPLENHLFEENNLTWNKNN